MHWNEQASREALVSLIETVISPEPTAAWYEAGMTKTYLIGSEIVMQMAKAADAGTGR